MAPLSKISKARSQRLSAKAAAKQNNLKAGKAFTEQAHTKIWNHAKNVKSSAPLDPNAPNISKPRPFDPYTSTDIAGPQTVVPLDAELSAKKPLKGLQIAVLVESQFVPQELALYANRFKEYGGEVSFVSRLWNQPKLTFHSHFDENMVPELRSMEVNKDLSTVDLSSGKVAAIIQPVHTQQRLLYHENIVGSADAVRSAREAPAVKLVEAALKDPKVVVGTFGHGAELLAPLTDLIKDAKFTASPASVLTVVHAGAQYVPPPDPKNWALHTVVDKSRGLNLVSGTSILHGGNEKFVDVLTRTVMEVRGTRP